MRFKNDHNSSPRAFPKVRILHNASYHVSKGPSTPEGSQNQLKLGPVECARAFGDMVGSVLSNSHLWKRSGARVMNIFVFYVGPLLLILDVLI